MKKIEEVKKGSLLTSEKLNEIINDVNELDERVKGLEKEPRKRLI